MFGQMDLVDMTYYDENTLVLTNESKSFPQDRIPAQNHVRFIPAHGAYTAAFTDHVQPSNKFWCI